MGEFVRPYLLVASSAGTVQIDVPEGLVLEQGREYFLSSPFCLVVRDPDGSGAAVRVRIGEQEVPFLLYEESHLLVCPGHEVMAGQNVAYRRPAWERPFRGYLRSLAYCLEVRSRPPRAYLCPQDGVVRLTEAVDGTNVFIEERDPGPVGAVGSPPASTGWYCGCFPSDQLAPCIRDGASVRPGEQLIRGNVWHRDRLNILGEDQAARGLIDELTSVLDANRMAVDPRAIALVVVRMLSYLCVESAPPGGPSRVGQVEDGWIAMRSSDEINARADVCHRTLLLGARLMARIARASSASA